MNIPWDLETTPLQIKTDSELGSGESVFVNVFNNAGSGIGHVHVNFSSPMKYRIKHCIGSYTDLPVQPPVEVEKIWTIIKTETAIIITCNNVEVVSYLFADSSESNCATKWDGDIVEKIRFSGLYDTSSDFYRAGKGL